MIRRIAFTISALLLGFANQAQAFINGNALTATYYYPDLSSPFYPSQTEIINGTTYLAPLANGYMSLYADDIGLSVDYSSTFEGYWSPGSFNGFKITDTNGTIPAFTSVSINPITNIVDVYGNPFNASYITFDDDNVYVNWALFQFDQSSVFRLDFNGLTPAVPEPATWAIMIAGFGLIGLTMRRSRRRTPALT